MSHMCQVFINGRACSSLYAFVWQFQHNVQSGPFSCTVEHSFQCKECLLTSCAFV